MGFDWSNAADAFTKIEEEIAELQETMAHESPEDFEEELGDLLFAVVNVARHRHTDPEGALRRATEKFQARFAKIEATLAAQGKTVEDATLAEMDTLWENVKTRG